MLCEFDRLSISNILILECLVCNYLSIDNPGFLQYSESKEAGVGVFSPVLSHQCIFYSSKENEENHYFIQYWGNLEYSCSMQYPVLSS